MGFNKCVDNLHNSKWCNMQNPEKQRPTKAMNANYRDLRDAIKRTPKDHLLDWLDILLADDPRISGEELEVLGNEIGRRGHYKCRGDME